MSRELAEALLQKTEQAWRHRDLLGKYWKRPDWGEGPWIRMVRWGRERRWL